MFTRISTILLVMFSVSCVLQPERPDVDCALQDANMVDNSAITITKDLKEVSEYIIKNNLPPDSTLVVFDIDDTLLESKNFVGGDAWYRWQTKKPVYNKKGNLVSLKEDEEFLCIYESLSTFYSYGTYEATQDDAPEIVRNLDSKYDMYFLTSRSPFYRNGTERELNAATYSPIDKSGEDSENLLYFEMRNKRDKFMPISVKNNIIMSTGVHKGRVLKRVLDEDKVSDKYTHIIFVDDGYENISNMKEAFDGNETMKLQFFFYTRVNKCIDTDMISESNTAKHHFDDFLMSSFPDGFESFVLKKCKYQ